jgi:hypothetical protein
LRNFLFEDNYIAISIVVCLERGEILCDEDGKDILLKMFTCRFIVRGKVYTISGKFDISGLRQGLHNLRGKRKAQWLNDCSRTHSKMADNICNNHILDRGIEDLAAILQLPEFPHNLINRT